MKKLFFYTVAFCLFICTQSHAQIKNIVKHAKDKTVEKADSEAGKSIDNSGNSNTDNSNAGTDTPPNNDQSQSNPDQIPPAPVSVTAYQNYDFRAGDKIIFEDNFATDPDGEFPSHWDLVNGQGVVNKITGIPSFLLTDGNYVRVKPYMNNESYLTGNFSVEFDTYMSEGAYGVRVFFLNSEGSEAAVQFSSADASWTGSDKDLSGTYPTALQSNGYFNKWHHIALAYKADQLKVYVDQYRVLTVPHCNFKPANIQFGGIGSQDDPIIFKDCKIADGATMNMLDKIMTDGKFVTHGISFDVNKAVIKPESMGVIGDLVKYMQANPSLKLEIDGHTDSDGSDAANLALSQQRAEAVKAAMTAAGIDASKLAAKGFGESKPLGTNDTPEGKAMNRRVEFVKM